MKFEVQVQLNPYLQPRLNRQGSRPLNTMESGTQVDDDLPSRPSGDGPQEGSWFDFVGFPEGKKVLVICIACGILGIALHFFSNRNSSQKVEDVLDSQLKMQSLPVTDTASGYRSIHDDPQLAIEAIRSRVRDRLRKLVKSPYSPNAEDGPIASPWGCFRRLLPFLVHDAYGTPWSSMEKA